MKWSGCRWLTTTAARSVGWMCAKIRGTNPGQDQAAGACCPRTRGSRRPKRPVGRCRRGQPPGRSAAWTSVDAGVDHHAGTVASRAQHRDLAAMPVQGIGRSRRSADRVDQGRGVGRPVRGRLGAIGFPGRRRPRWGADLSGRADFAGLGDSVRSSGGSRIPASDARAIGRPVGQPAAVPGTVIDGTGACRSSRATTRRLAASARSRPGAAPTGAAPRTPRGQSCGTGRLEGPRSVRPRQVAHAVDEEE